MVNTIKDNFIIKKRNVLNEIRANSMTLQELRFFSIYLSKINPADVNTRVVRFSVSDFQSIMDLGRINIDYMKQVTTGLLCKVVNMPNEYGGYVGFQLFKECVVSIDDNAEWYVEIDAHDKALPLMFEFKERYFSYQLWNALRLRSSNQLRMYEILKQYEKIGTRILPVEELRNLIGIEPDEYKRYGDFKIKVLDACQQALAENTDIKFTYEPYGNRGNGGKILYLKFTIQKNTDYVDQLTLDRFIEYNRQENELSPYDSKMIFLSDACNNEFTVKEIMVLHDIMAENLPHATIHDELACYNHLMRKYREMEMRNEKGKIKHRFAYMKSIIGTE